MKGKVTHYVVLDLPADNPMAPVYQRAWLDANYGSAAAGSWSESSRPSTAAVSRAASLCKRN